MARVLQQKELVKALQVQLEGEPVTRIEAQAFGLVRETYRRTLGLDPFDVQMLAALALADDRLVEMQTGEGKTLAAVFPVFLNALAGRA